MSFKKNITSNLVLCLFLLKHAFRFKNYPAINAEIQGDEIVYKIIII